MRTAAAPGKRRPQWLAPALRALGALIIVVGSAYLFATSAHGYEASYVHPLVLIFAAAFILVGGAPIAEQLRTDAASSMPLNSLFSHPRLERGKGVEVKLGG